MYILKILNHHFNFCVSKSFYYNTDDVLLRKAFTDILNCCDIHLTYILYVCLSEFDRGHLKSNAKKDLR